MYLRLSATPGSEETLPREAPTRRVVHPVLSLCGAGVEPPRGRGRPSGAREAQVFFGYIWVRFSATPGSERTRPREGASQRSPLAELGTTPVHSAARHRLLCGWDVAPPRRRGKPSGARESQVFFGGCDGL